MKRIIVLFMLISFLSLFFNNSNYSSEVQISLPNFEITRIFDEVTGNLTDLYVITEYLYLHDIVISGCHIKATGGTIIFEGDVILNNTVISSDGDLELIFRNSKIIGYRTFIWANGYINVTASNTSFTFDYPSYFHARAISFMAENISDTTWRNMSLYSLSSTLHLYNVDNMTINNITVVRRSGIMRIYYGLTIITDNCRNIDLIRYYGADLRLLADNSFSLCIRDIYDDIGWLDFSIDARNSSATIEGGTINSLSAELNDSQLYLYDLNILSKIDIGESIRYIKLHNVSIHGIELELIRNLDSYNIANGEDTIYYLYNISHIHTDSTALNRVIIYESGEVNLRNCEIKSLSVNNCTFTSIDNISTNNFHANKVNAINISSSTIGSIYCQNVNNLTILGSSLSYIELKNLHDARIINSSITNRVYKRDNETCVMFSGFYVDTIRYLDIENAVISSTRRDEANVLIYRSYSEVFYVINATVLKIKEVAINMKYSIIGSLDLSLRDVSLYTSNMVFLTCPRHIELENMMINGTDALFIDSKTNITANNSFVIVFNSVDISIVGSKFLYVFNSSHINIRSMEGALNMLHCSHISISGSDIYYAYLDSMHTLSLYNSSLSGRVYVGDSINIYVQNCHIYKSEITFFRCKNISLMDSTMEYKGRIGPRILELLYTDLRLNFLGCSNIYIYRSELTCEDCEYSAMVIYITNSWRIRISDFHSYESSIFLYVVSSIDVSISDIFGNGKYMGIGLYSVTELDVNGIRSPKNSSYVYVYGSRKFDLREINVGAVGVEASMYGVVEDVVVDKVFYISAVRDLTINRIETNGYGFIPELTADEFGALDIGSIKYASKDILILYKKSGVSLHGTYGEVLIVGSSNIDFENSLISSLVVIDSRKIDVYGTDIFYGFLDHLQGLHIRQSTMYGALDLYDSEDIQFEDNVILSEINIIRCDDISFRQNLYKYKKWGMMRVFHSANVSITRNKFYGLIIYLKDCLNISFTGNTIKNSYPVGLMVWDSILVEIKDNKFVGCGTGGHLTGHWWWYYQIDGKDIGVTGAIWIYNCRFVIIAKNVFSSNSYNAFVDDSKRVYFIANSFYDIHNFFIVDSDYYFYYKRCGNYWEKYNGGDSNNDGIGDEPYYFNGNVDMYPLVSPIRADYVVYLWTEIAILAFPIYLLGIFFLAYAYGIFIFQHFDVKNIVAFCVGLLAIIVGIFAFSYLPNYSLLKSTGIFWGLVLIIASIISILLAIEYEIRYIAKKLSKNEDKQDEKLILGTSKNEEKKVEDIISLVLSFLLILTIISFAHIRTGLLSLILTVILPFYIFIIIVCSLVFEGYVNKKLAIKNYKPSGPILYIVVLQLIILFLFPLFSLVVFRPEILPALLGLQGSLIHLRYKYLRGHE